MMKLHHRSDLHIARKVWHLTMGCAIAIVYSLGMSRSGAVMLLGFVLAFDLFVETIRLKVPQVNEKVIKFWGPLMRRCEQDRLTGAPYYLAASILAIGIFPRPIAVLSILYLACGDPIASLFGVLYGDKGPRFTNGKSWIGTGAGMLTCMMVTWFYGQNLGWSVPTLIAMTIIGGIAGGSAELLPLDVDDNFSIPIVSGFALWLAVILI
ncbi:MAG: hypothetical protein JNL01_07015 [Bdellovibrionales bacterium]|nr:hypothetical protein [Bdellovibrionales bacterium]